MLLTRIQLNDQRFIDVSGKLVTIRRCLESALGLLDIYLDPARHPHLLCQLQGFHNAILLLRLVAHGDHITGLDHVRRDVDGLAVHRHGLVGNQLTCFSARRTETHAVDHIVKTRFQNRQQVGAGVALAAVSLFKVASELLLQNALHALDLLLLAKLQAVVGRTGTGGAAVLTWLGVELGLVTNGAACALEEQVGAFTAG